MTVKDHVLDPQEIHIIKSSSGRHLGMGNDLLNLVEWIDLYNLYIMTDTVSCHQVSRGPVCLRATICPADEAQTLANSMPSSAPVFRRQTREKSS